MAESDIGDMIDYSRIPIAALNASARRKLSMALNQDMPLPGKNGFVRNWEGLAELVGIPYASVKLLKNRDDPTRHVIEQWEERRNPMVSELLNCLEQLERYEVQDDIRPLIQRDALSFLSQEEESRRNYDATCPVQVREVTSGPLTSQSHKLTVGDMVIQSQNPGIPSFECARYDAYVSYTDNDVDFVTKLISVLEVEKNLKLFVKDRDLLPGVLEYEAEVKMLHERCDRILLVLSEEFLTNPRCEFQTMFAQALAVDNNLYARKVIPIIYKPCELPVGLKYIAKLDYTKSDVFGSFWQRLHSSISSPMACESRQGRVSPSPPIPSASTQSKMYLVANPNNTISASRSLTNLTGNQNSGYWPVHNVTAGQTTYYWPNSSAGGQNATPNSLHVPGTATNLSMVPASPKISSQSLVSIPDHISHVDKAEDRPVELRNMSATVGARPTSSGARNSPTVVKKKRYFFQRKIQENMDMS